MRKALFGFAIASLMSCLSPVEDATNGPHLLGVYRGDYGAMTRLHGLESELILRLDGTYRFFLVDSNTAVYTSKGGWKAKGNEMVWTGVARSPLYHGVFRIWDTLAAADTSYIRNVTDRGFERLEATVDTLYAPVVQWVKYRQIPAEKPLPEGAFQFTETYLDGIDTTIVDTAVTRLEITRGGPYIQHIFHNGKLYSTDVDSQWTQAGSFVVTSHNHFCSYETDDPYCGDGPSDFEYVARLSDIGDTGFHLWLTRDFTFLLSPYWADFRKAP